MKKLNLVLLPLTLVFVFITGGCDAVNKGDTNGLKEREWSLVIKAGKGLPDSPQISVDVVGVYPSQKDQIENNDIDSFFKDKERYLAMGIQRV